MTEEDDEEELHDALRAWATAFRAAAEDDQYQLLRERLGEVGFVAEVAPAAVENTIERVAALTAYAAMEDRSIDELLRLQTYDPSASGARYLLRFEPHVAFLAVDRLRQVDLADLFNHPPGFTSMDVEHIDGSPFEQAELDELTRAVREDFAYDFEEDELTLEIYESESGLGVNVCESDEEPPWR